MFGLDSSTVLNFISYTPDVPTPTPTPTPDPTVVGLLTPQTGDIASLLIILFGIVATVSIGLFLGRNISHNVKSVFAAFCASMLPLVLAGSCVVGINSMAVAENSANLVNPQIDVYVNTEGGPVHYGEGATSNVQKFTNDTEDEVTISEVQFKIVDQASDVFVGQWTGKLSDGTLLFSGGAGDTYKLENPISLGAGESFEVTWSTDTQSEDLFDCIGKAPVSICYVVSSNKHTVIFDSNGGSEVASQEVGHGQTAAEPSEPTKDNNEFIWWASDEKLSNQFDFDTPVTEDLTLYAKWEVTEEYVEEVKEKAAEEADKAKKEVEEELKELLTEEELELVKDSMDDLLDEFKKALEDAKTSEEVEQAKKKFEDDLLDIEKEALKGGSEKQEKEAEEALDDIPGLSEGDIERYKKKLQNKKDEIDKKIEDSSDFENAKKEQEKFDPAADELLKEAIKLGENKDEAREANEDLSQATEEKIETFTSLLPETIQKYKKKVQDLKKTTGENIDEAESSEDVENVIKEQKENIEKILQEIQKIISTKKEVQAATQKELKEKQDQIGNLPDLNSDVKAQYVEKLKQKETEFQTKLKQTDDLDEINKVFKELEDSFNSIFADAKDFSDKIVNSKEDLNNLALNEMEKIEDNPDINSFDEAYLIKQIDDLNKKGTADIPNSKSKEEVEKKLAKYKADINNISSNLVTIRFVVTGGEGHFEDLHNKNVPITTKTDVKGATCGLGIYVGQGMRLVSVVDSTPKTYTVGGDGSFEARLTSAFTITATVEETQDEAYAYLNDTKDTLTFTYDAEKDSHEFAWNCENTQDYPPWDKYVGHGTVADSSVKYVTFTDTFKSNASSVNNCKNWFYGYGTEISAANSNIVQFNNMSNCDFSNVTSMAGMFAYCNNIESPPDLSKWGTSTKLTSTANMFSGCTKMTTAPNFSGFNTKGLKRIDHMFFDCKSMATIPNIVNWDVSTVEDFSILFYGCTSLKGLLDLSKWNPVSATSFDGAFHSCTGLTDINISSFDFSIKKPDTGSSYGMFNSCSSLEHIFYNRDASGIWTSQQSKWMFFNCAKLPHWNTDSDKTDKTYAYPNNGEHGFFTDPHPTVTLKPFEGGHYEDVANAYIDRISGDWNSTDTQVKVVIDDHSLIVASVDDNGGNHYELTGDNCFLVDFSARYTITVTTGSAIPEAYAAISSSENGNKDTLTFYYDPWISTHGDLAWNCENTTTSWSEKVPWGDYVGQNTAELSSVTKVVFTNDFKACGKVTSTYKWFAAKAPQMSKITEFVNTAGCDFSNVTTMAYMFAYCQSITQPPDMTNWATSSSLKDLTYMFGCASALETAPDISSLDTSHVESFAQLFNECSKIKNGPDLRGLNFESATTLRQMFCSCQAMVEPPTFAQKLNIPKVTDMYGMFTYDREMTSAPDMSGWITGDNTLRNLGAMFCQCKKLEEINIEGLKINSNTDIGGNWGTGMFSYCENLSSIYYSKDISNVVSKANSVDTFLGTNVPHYDENNVDSTYAYPNNGVTGYFSTLFPTITLQFENEGDGHFEDSSGNIITSTRGDYGSANTIKVVPASGKKINKVINNTGFEYAVGEDGSFMISYDACYIITASVSVLEAYAALVSSSENSPNDTLLFNYDGNKDTYQNAWNCENTLGELPGWTSYVGGGEQSESTVTSVVFSNEFKQEGSKHVACCDYWFYSHNDYSKIISFDISNCNFINSSSFTSMFEGCVNTEDIDISGWTTGERLYSTGSMFYGCKKLKSGPDLSSFDVSFLSSMSFMFCNCEAMTTPPVMSGGNWSESKIEGVGRMFCGCQNLSEVNINSINFDEGCFANEMFKGCTSLTKIYCNRDLSNVLNKENSKDMFKGCSVLTNIATDNVYDCTYAYPDDGQGYGHFTELPKEAYAAITTANAENDTLELHYDDLKSIYSITFDNILQAGLNDPKWKEYTYGSIKSVKNVVVKPEFSQVAPTTMKSWFKSQWNINSISGLANINTSNVINMSSLFYEYNGTNTIDGISNWDTSSVVNMSDMFYYAKFKTMPPVSGWNVSNVEHFDRMFSSCINITTPIDLSAWTVKTASSSSFGAISFSNTFSECSNTPSININFDVEGVKIVGPGMFFSCGALTNIYCDNNWTSVLTEHSENMFGQCWKLSHFSTADFTDGRYAYPWDGEHGLFTSTSVAINTNLNNPETIMSFINNSSTAFDTLLSLLAAVLKFE